MVMINGIDARTYFIVCFASNACGAFGVNRLLLYVLTTDVYHTTTGSSSSSDIHIRGTDALTCPVGGVRSSMVLFPATSDAPFLNRKFAAKKQLGCQSS